MDSQVESMSSKGVSNSTGSVCVWTLDSYIRCQRPFQGSELRVNARSQGGSICHLPHLCLCLSHLHVKGRTVGTLTLTSGRAGGRVVRHVVKTWGLRLNKEKGSRHEAEGEREPQVLRPLHQRLVGCPANLCGREHPRFWLFQLYFLFQQ